MKKVVVLIMILAILAGLAGCGQSTEPAENEAAQAETLTVYCGAGMQKPMDEIAAAFKEEKGVNITFNFAGSAQLLSQIELSGQGDLYMPGSLNDMKIAEEKELIKEYREVVFHIPAIGVPKGNPAGIMTLSDLGRPGVKVVLGDEQACAIGKKAVKILQKNNLLEAVQSNVVAKDATVNEVVTHVAIGQADASIIWEDNATGFENIEIIPIEDPMNIIEKTPLGILKVSEKEELAQEFLDYVMSPKCAEIFVKYGFKPVSTK